MLQAPIPEDWHEGDGVDVDSLNAILQCLREFRDAITRHQQIMPMFAKTPPGGIPTAAPRYALCQPYGFNPFTGALIAGDGEIKVWQWPAATSPTPGNLTIAVMMVNHQWFPLEAC
jgi:hypothetical protein